MANDAASQRRSGPEGHGSWTHTRAKIANHRRNHPDDDPPAGLYRDHAAARIESYIREIVDLAPPLTPDQRNRIALLLRPTSTAGGGAP
jgi:hypothetical protein